MKGCFLDLFVNWELNKKCSPGISEEGLRQRVQLLNWSGEAPTRLSSWKRSYWAWASSLTLFSYSGSEFPLEKTGIESGVMSGLSLYCISERRNPSFLIRRFLSYHVWLIKVWYVGIRVSIDWHRLSLINSSKKASLICSKHHYQSSWSPLRHVLFTM